MKATLRALLLASCIGNAYAATPAVSGNIMWTHQQSDRAAVVAENTLSADLMAEGTVGAIGWLVHAEGNTTPDDRGPSALGAHGAAGVATDSRGNGRIQISEAYLSTKLFDGILYGGLIDLTSLADASDVANDETIQFLNNDLIHNTTIAFPDYDLGLVWTSERLTVLIGKNNGLADENGDYQRLFTLTNPHTGTFLLAETSLTTAANPIRIGIWKHDYQDNNKAGWGAYLNTDQTLGGLDWNLRLGWANDTAQDAARFASLAAQKSWQRWTLGLGHAATFGSGPRHAADRHVSEGYLRYAVNAHFDVSADVQRISEQTDTWVYGTRVLWHF